MIDGGWIFNVHTWRMVCVCVSRTATLPSIWLYGGVKLKSSTVSSDVVAAWTIKIATVTHPCTSPVRTETSPSSWRSATPKPAWTWPTRWTKTTHPKLYLSHGREKKKQSALLLSVWLDVLSSDWLYLCSCCKNCIYSGLCWQCSVSNTWYAVWFQRHIFPHTFLLRRFYFDTLYFNGFSDGITFFTHTNISSRTIQTGGVHQQTTAALPEVMFAFLHLALKKRHQSPLSLDVKDFSWHN